MTGALGKYYAISKNLSWHISTYNKQLFSGITFLLSNFTFISIYTLYKDFLTNFAKIWETGSTVR